jgi:hypothetical protein
MFGLLRRLSAVDVDAASAVRVIGFFDTLLEQRADIDLIMRQTATLAECPVGVRNADGQFCQRLEPGGEPRFGGPPPAAQRYRFPSGDEVWLERAGDEHPLDDLVLERFAIAATVALGRGDRDVDALDQSALLQLAVNASTPDSARRRVLERLGLRPAATVHLLALAGPAERLDELSGRLSGKHRAQVGGIRLLLATQPPPDMITVPAGCRIGIAAPQPAADLPQAWQQARTALRFTLPSAHPAPPYPPYHPPVVLFDSLGSFGPLAEALTADQISRLPDVIVLDTLAQLPGGEEMLQTLEAVAATDSLRRAAAVLHMHHNSVAHRVTRAEQALGFSVADLYARPRLNLAIALRRIRESAELF